jgi:hypothetical protein
LVYSQLALALGLFLLSVLFPHIFIFVFLLHLPLPLSSSLIQTLIFVLLCLHSFTIILPTELVPAIFDLWGENGIHWERVGILLLESSSDPF